MIQPISKAVVLHIKVVLGLQVQPETLGETEVARQSKGFVFAETARVPWTISLIRFGVGR